MSSTRGASPAPPSRTIRAPRASSSAPSSPSRCGSQRRRGSVAPGCTATSGPAAVSTRASSASRARAASARSCSVTATCGRRRTGSAPTSETTSSQRIRSCWNAVHGTVRSSGAAPGARLPAVTRAPNRSRSGFALPPPPCSCTPRSKSPRPHGRAERLDDLGRVVRRPVRAGLPPHARDPRGGQHLVHRRRPAVEQRSDRGRSHQRDRRVRVGGPQGGERGLRHDVVAEAVGAQHHDPVHRGHRTARRREESVTPRRFPVRGSRMPGAAEITAA